MIKECYNYLFAEFKNGPKFSRLENFPIQLSTFIHTNYVVFANNLNSPILLPYLQVSYSSDIHSPFFRRVHCPWKNLISALKILEKEGEMKGKLCLHFNPRIILDDGNRELMGLVYYLVPYPYGYVVFVEQWANLRKPSDFPVCSDWHYKTSYLTFQSRQFQKRAFFPYSVQGKVLEKNPDGSLYWRILAQEQCEYLKPRVINQFRKDKWFNIGQFEITFQGSESLEKESDILQFLFGNL